MAYNYGVFSLFNEAQNFTNVYADQQSPTFSPPATFSYSTVYGKSIAPTIKTTGSGVVNTAYGQQIAPSVSAGVTVSNVYGLNLIGPALSAGTISTVYTLFVAPPNFTGGTITNNYTAYFGLPSTGTVKGGVGIGTTTPLNALDVNGGVAIGSYASTTTVAYGNLAISGNGTTTIIAGVGTSSPMYTLDIGGTLNAGAAYGWMPQARNQIVQLSEGYNQGGFGGGSVGTNKTNSINTTAVFDVAANVNSLNTGFAGGLFDGRYLYLIPNENTLTFSGQILRYDATQPFSASSSYVIYDTGLNINSNSRGFQGAIFDGRYLYLVPNNTGISNSGQITRYDTTGSFTLVSSYATFDTGANVNSNSVGFKGAVFDGRYIYFVPFANNTTLSGQITLYDTTLPFTAASSYTVFDTAGNVNSNSVGFIGGVYDGRYVYLVPSTGFSSNNSFSGQITQYDTTLPFATASSYSVFDTGASLTSLSRGFFSGVFDGRYIYLAPFMAAATFTGLITRYDTTLPFGVSTSYAVFNSTAVNATSVGFNGASFDGRYIYFAPYRNNTTVSGRILRFDTTNLFTATSSYTLFNAATVNSNCVGFTGSVFDGKYVYMVPNINSVVTNGSLLTRLDAYPGPQATAIAATQAPNGFAVGSYTGTPSPNNLIVRGMIGVATATPSVLFSADSMVINAQQQVSAVGGTTWVNQTVQLAQGNNQGGFGSGSVGTNKTMSANTTVVFDTNANVSSLSENFTGGVFDGRYIYFTSAREGLNFVGVINRYDTTQPFDASTSYSLFNIGSLVNANSVGLFSGGSFDGRYVYYPSYRNNTTQIGQLTQYDTTLPFGASSSYAFFNTETNLSSLCVGFFGSIFDGRYIYLVPSQGLTTSSGTVTRYDTTLPFGASASYSFYNMAANVNSFSLGFVGAVFDGRYVYFLPNVNGLGTTGGQITQYDTTLSFTSSSGYSYFNTQSLNTNSTGFEGGVFDGRYIYLIPNNVEGSGLITRYDTTLPFGASTSYAFFDTEANVNSNSVGFHGGVFDGRYLYLVPDENGTGGLNGQVTRYDTTQPFGLSTSYSIFDTAANVNSNSGEFNGAVFDGRYIYFIPGSLGQITRMDAYPGPQAVVMNAISANNGLTLLGGGNIVLTSTSTAGTATAGSASALPANSAGYITISINGTVQKIPFFNP